MDRIKYVTWIRPKKIILFSLITIALLISGVILIVIPYAVDIDQLAFIICGSLLMVMSLPFWYISFILIYSYWWFSDFGGKIQDAVHQLIISNIKTSIGPCQILDVGCGSGSLAIKIAKANINNSVYGVDYWGGEWGQYSKSLCENNARLEKVDHQIQWVQSSASKLPFENDKFDVIVSCLTFHEVKDQLDKVQLFNEQLRVLKPSGQFIFMDLFLEKKIFGDYQTFINAISTKGVSSFEHIKLDQLIKIPKLLLSKKVLGNAVLIKAIKN